MRHLKSGAGFTLIELMVSLSIGVFLVGLASPYFGDYVNNSRMREGGNALLAEALFAQSEALKRNGPVRLEVSATSVRVIDIGVQPAATLRERAFGGDILADVASVDFGSTGTPLPFGTDAAINVGKSGITCSAEVRCPGLRIDGGGGIRLCGNHLSCL
jgi:type IV fimbrial biogenesis protein FimT